MFDSIQNIFQKTSEIYQKGMEKLAEALSEDDGVCYPEDHDQTVQGDLDTAETVKINQPAGSSQAHVELLEENVGLDTGAETHPQLKTKGKHQLPLNHSFEITQSGKAQLYTWAAVDELVGEERYNNDRLGSLKLQRLSERGSWDDVQEKALFRGRFGDSKAHKIGLEADLKPGYYRFDVQGDAEVKLEPEYTVDFGKDKSKLKAATWNMLWEKEPMDRHTWGSATHYTKAMAGPEKTGAWDSNVIFFQEVDKGDWGYDYHQVLNLIDGGLNRKPDQRDWSLTWGYDDHNLVGRVNSYLVTNVKRDIWPDPSGGALGFSSLPQNWAVKQAMETAAQEGTDEAKGYFSKDQIEAAGGKFMGSPGKHDQVGNQFLLGTVYNYKYYMNVTKAKMPNGEGVYLANIHLKSGKDYSSERKAQVRKAVDYLQRLAKQDPDFDGRILMAGDFNSYQIGPDEGAKLLKVMREKMGYAVDASMASEFKADPDKYMEKPEDWNMGKPPETWDRVPTFIGRDGSIKNNERFDAFILLGEGWRHDLITDFHFAGPKEFEVHRKKDFIPDGPEHYNYGRPVADTDHLPGRVHLSLSPDEDAPDLNP